MPKLNVFFKLGLNDVLNVEIVLAFIPNVSKMLKVILGYFQSYQQYFN